jgi:acetyltransferase-like isoleucine patch superfamily enzyme
MRFLIQILLLFLPWPVRRRALNAAFNYQIDPSAHIGWSLILPRRLRMGTGSRIGSLTLVKGLSELAIETFGDLGHLNWVSGFPEGRSDHFAEDTGRYPALRIGAHAAITHRHLIDCTDTVTIGAFTTFAGWGSQILTHAIDLKSNRQSASPVSIGDYCFVGTRSVFLKGAIVPDHCVVAAGTIVAGPLEQTWSIYGGSPARHVKDLDKSYAYFSRPTGFVN